MYWGEACTVLQASLVDDWVCQRELVKAKLRWPQMLAYRQMTLLPLGEMTYSLKQNVA